jgi:hypothetical protein
MISFWHHNRLDIALIQHLTQTNRAKLLKATDSDFIMERAWSCPALLHATLAEIWDQISGVTLPSRQMLKIN